MYPVGKRDESLFEYYGGRRLSLVLTPARILAFVVGMTAAVLLTVAVERLGFHLPLIRECLAVIYLSLIPGYLAYRIIDITPRYRVEAALYSLGLSLTTLMIAGLLVNFGLRSVGVTAPISELPMVLSVCTFVLILTVVFYWRNLETRTVHFAVDDLTSPLALSLALLPFLGIYGGLALTYIDTNILLLVLYGIIGIVPFLVLRGTIPQRYLPAILWVIALSLLLQNTLTGRYLAWGDQPKEAELALSVLRNGYWIPSNAPGLGSKFAMLRVVMLHPIYALFTDMKLVWVFKFVHPLIFSALPVVLYQAYRRLVGENAAFLSSFLFVSLFSYFIVLSRNTRTATAILFLGLVALLVIDTDLNPKKRNLLSMLFVASIVVSHYGVSYMVLFALVVAYVLTLLGQHVLGEDYDARTVLTSKAFVGFYAVSTFAWYLYASPDSKAFNLVVGFGRSFVSRLSEFFIAPEGESATARYLVSDFTSTTLTSIKYYNVLIGGVIVVGVAVTLWRVYRKQADESPISTDTEYLAYAVVFLGMFAFTFLPVERFNTARTYPTTLIFFAPFFVVGVIEIARLVKRSGSVDTRLVQQVAAVVVVGYFLLNVGFISATVTNEYSTNALVEKERIMEDGHPVEKAYFYKQYPTTYGVESTAWLRSHGTDSTTLYQSGWPGGMKGSVGYESLTDEPARGAAFETRQISGEDIESGRLGEGYVYLSAYNVIGNVIRLPGGHFEYNRIATSEAASAWSGKNKIYANGGSAIYY